MSFGLLTDVEMEKIEELAEWFLREEKGTRLDDALLERIISSDESLISLKKIAVKPFSGSLDEHLTREGVGYVLSVSDTIPHLRRRLLVAKGVARLILSKYQLELGKEKEEDYIFGTDWTHRQNDEINFMALCLMMPKSAFQKVVEEKALNHLNGRVNIEQLAQEFNVSEQNATQRGLSLGMFTASRQVSSK